MNPDFKLGHYQKWIVGDTRRLGPTRESFVLIPRHHYFNEDWYFWIGDKEAVPATRLFDTPQEAALAAIAIHDEEIRWAGVQKQNLQEWYDQEEAAREAREKAERDAANAPPKEAMCPVCKRTIGLIKGRFARHKVQWPQHRNRVPCHGSGREAEQL